MGLPKCRDLPKSDFFVMSLSESTSADLRDADASQVISIRGTIMHFDGANETNLRPVISILFRGSVNIVEKSLKFWFALPKAIRTHLSWSSIDATTTLKLQARSMRVTHYTRKKSISNDNFFFPIYFKSLQTLTRTCETCKKVEDFAMVNLNSLHLWPTSSPGPSSAYEWRVHAKIQDIRVEIISEWALNFSPVSSSKLVNRHHQIHLHHLIHVSRAMNHGSWYMDRNSGHAIYFGKL